MDTLPAISIVHALGSHGEASNPVYPEKNLLPIWATLSDLHLEVLRPWPESAVEGQTDILTLMLAIPGGGFIQVLQLSLAGLITFPLKLKLDRQLLVDGESQIYFQVRTHNQNTYQSEPTSFTVDKLIPLKGERPSTPIVDEDLYDGPGVTEGYLKRHCDVVKVTIPGYPGSRKGDSVVILFGPLNPPPVAKALINVGGETVVVLHRGVFEALKNGVCLLHYLLESRAGAQTPLSTGKFIRINFPPKNS